MEEVQANQFVYWAWINQEIQLPEANADIDLKLDYIRSTVRNYHNGRYKYSITYQEYSFLSSI